MIVEAVSYKGRSTNATTRAHAQRRWEKNVSFLFHLPFFLQANPLCIIHDNYAYSVNSFSSGRSAHSTASILP